MTKHTQEPWRVETRGNLRARQFIEAGQFRIAECLTRDQAANARRIIACVNACAGIPTEALEIAVEGDAATDTVDRLECLAVQIEHAVRDIQMAKLRENGLGGGME